MAMADQPTLGDRSKQEANRRPKDYLDTEGSNSEIPQHDGGKLLRHFIDRRQRVVRERHHHDIRYTASDPGIPRAM